VCILFCKMSRCSLRRAFLRESLLDASARVPTACLPPSPLPSHSRTCPHLLRPPPSRAPPSPPPPPRHLGLPLLRIRAASSTAAPRGADSPDPEEATFSSRGEPRSLLGLPPRGRRRGSIRVVATQIPFSLPSTATMMTAALWEVEAGANDLGRCKWGCATTIRACLVRRDTTQIFSFLPS
jgi:hypothetical protein